MILPVFRKTKKREKTYISLKQRQAELELFVLKISMIFCIVRMMKIIIIVVISIAPYLTYKGEHNVLYKITSMYTQDIKTDT